MGKKAKKSVELVLLTVNALEERAKRLQSETDVKEPERRTEIKRPKPLM